MGYSVLGPRSPIDPFKVQDLVPRGIGNVHSLVSTHYCCKLHCACEDNCLDEEG